MIPFQGNELFHPRLTQISKAFEANDSPSDMLGKQERNAARLMVLPAVGLLFLVTIAPLLFSLGVSFTNLQFGSPQPMRWIGLDNYLKLVYQGCAFSGRSLAHAAAGRSGSRDSDRARVHHCILTVPHPTRSHDSVERDLDSVGYLAGCCGLARADDFQCLIWSAQRPSGSIRRQGSGLARVAADGVSHDLSDRHLAMDTFPGADHSRRIAEPYLRTSWKQPAWTGHTVGPCFGSSQSHSYFR